MKGRQPSRPLRGIVGPEEVLMEIMMGKWVSNLFRSGRDAEWIESIWSAMLAREYSGRQCESKASVSTEHSDRNFP